MQSRWSLELEAPAEAGLEQTGGAVTRRDNARARPISVTRTPPRGRRPGGTPQATRQLAGLASIVLIRTNESESWPTPPPPSSPPNGSPNKGVGQLSALSSGPPLPAVNRPRTLRPTDRPRVAGGTGRLHPFFNRSRLRSCTPRDTVGELQASDASKATPQPRGGMRVNRFVSSPQLDEALSGEA